MASHFISNDYLVRNKKTMDKVSVATPAGFTVPSWRAGKAYEKAQEISFQGKVALKHSFVAIEKLSKKRAGMPTRCDVVQAKHNAMIARRREKYNAKD